MPSDVRDVALLVASELVTNAVMHARTPLQLGVTKTDDWVLIAVGDRNLLRPEQQPYSEHAPGGRGLAIVQSFSDTWGTLPTDTGKTVWSALRLNGDASDVSHARGVLHA